MNNKEIQALIRKIQKDLSTKITETEKEHYFINRILDFSENKDYFIDENTVFCFNCRDILFTKDKRKIFCSHHCFKTNAWEIAKHNKTEQEECLVEKYLNKSVQHKKTGDKKLSKKTLFRKALSKKSI